MTRPTPLPLAIAQRMATESAAASCNDLLLDGATDNDLERWVRQGLIERRGRNRYVLPPPRPTDQHEARRIEHLTDLRAILAVALDAAVGLRSAALLHGLPVYAVPPAPEIIRANHRGRPKGSRTIRLVLPEIQQVTVTHLRATSLERTAVDIALDLPTSAALITADAALGCGASRTQMQQILARRGPVRGCRAARRTLDWADPYAESPGESYSRGQLLSNGVARPACNVTLSWHGTTFRVDNLWEELGIVGESDGRIKYEGKLETPRTLWQEKLRQHWLEERGLLVLRWISEEIREDAAGVAQRWRQLEHRRLREPWQRPPGLTTRRDPLRAPSSGPGPAF